MLRSLRARLLLASVLWTMGLLLVMHLLTLMLMHIPSVFRFRGIFPLLMGVVLMGAGVAGLWPGLLRLQRLRDRLTAVRLGDESRIAGQFPSEVQPLIDDMNALLENREKAVKRALATAGDLAHGLKTPLALLAQDADRADAAGNHELAASIAQQVERMSRQVNYHLARARAAASGATAPVRCPLAPCADALVRTLSKLYGGRALDISVRIAPELAARVQREDLEEMLGNLLDNACKWARSRIALAATVDGAMLVLTIDDDGPGLSPEQRSLVLLRGVRLDQAARGSGLGLGIVRDLAELYGGSIALAESPLGGLRARLDLAAC